MENNFEVIVQSLNLSCTVAEGLEHIKSKFEEGYYEDALLLFQDVVHAVMSIENAIAPFILKLPPNQLAFLKNEVQDALEIMMTAYEGGVWNTVNETMEQSLLPAYYRWKEELERCLRLYMAS
ncbi:MAG: hypothetical protein ABRQ26_13105 [Syntrophomonadaceae bacterium]